MSNVKQLIYVTNAAGFFEYEKDLLGQIHPRNIHFASTSSSFWSSFLLLGPSPGGELIRFVVSSIR